MTTYTITKADDGIQVEILPDKADARLVFISNFVTGLIIACILPAGFVLQRLQTSQPIFTFDHEFWLQAGWFVFWLVLFCIISFLLLWGMNMQETLFIDDKTLFLEKIVDQFRFQRRRSFPLAEIENVRVGHLRSSFAPVMVFTHNFKTYSFGYRLSENEIRRVTELVKENLNTKKK